jgi:nucleoside-diphosphate-sugar epimerase
MKVLVTGASGYIAGNWRKNSRQWVTTSPVWSVMPHDVEGLNG